MLARFPGVIVADRGQAGGNGTQAGTTGINTNSRHVYTALYDCTDLRVVFANHIADGEPNAAVGYQASIEWPLGGGVYYKAYFDGKRMRVADPGATLVTDPVGIEVAKGQQFAVRTFTQQTGTVQTLTPSATLTAGSFTVNVNGVTLTVAFNASIATIQAAVENVVGKGNVVASGGPINTTAVTLTFAVPFMLLSGVASGGLTGGTITAAIGDKPALSIPTDTTIGDAFEFSTTATAKDTTGTISGANQAAGPALILGRAFSNNIELTRIPTVAGIGDSIVSGTGDLNKYQAHPGWFNRLTQLLGVAYMNLGLPGEQGSSFVGTAGQHRRQLLQLATAAICDYPGVNDIKNGRTLAQMQADLLSIGTFCQRRGIKVWQTTATPYQATSADSWTSTGSQTSPYTSAALEAVRVSFNAWVRDGLPIDATSLAAVATGTNTNVLRAGRVGHPFTGWVEVADLVEPSRNAGTWAPGPWTGTINTTNANNVVTVATTTSGALRVGDILVATGLQTGSRISAINGSQVTLIDAGASGFGGGVRNATATASGVSAATAQTFEGIHPTGALAAVIAASVQAAIGAQLSV